MNNHYNYNSVFANEFKRFIEIRKSLGLTILRYKWIFKEIDDYAISQNLEKIIITREFFEGWRKTRINDAVNTLCIKYSVWVQLARQMCRNGYTCYIPQIPKRQRSSCIPYIFTDEQIATFFKECDKMKVYDSRMCVSMISYPALFRLLYSTGLRITEALSIKNEDVNMKQRYIHIRKTKNGSERIVPICESMAQVLEKYILFRNKMPVNDISLPNHRFFVKCDGTAVKHGGVYRRFLILLNSSNIPYIGNHHGPRIHDLRHTFAVHALIQMERNGIDLYTSLPILSICLGHKSIKGTEQYVRLTSIIYSDLEKQCSPINSIIYSTNNQ